jgi:2-polyprenyl-6-methoxyphenol hydroxylase-like FAD-dependent oxidoreductase
VKTGKHSTEVPVLVAGGGPVGLVTALELQSRGIQTLVIERNPGTTQHPKMDVTNSRSMEHFRRLGVAERIRDAAVPRGNRMDVVWVTRLSEWELARFSYPDVHTWRARIRATNDGCFRRP